MRKILVLNSSISLTDCEFNPTGEGGLVDISVMIWFIGDKQSPGSKRILACFCPFQIEPQGSNRAKRAIRMIRRQSRSKGRNSDRSQSAPVRLIELCGLSYKI